MSFIDINKTYDMLFEERVLIAKDNVSTQNKLKPKPQGILITDSYNNPFFPITPKPKIDTAKLDLLEVFKRYKELYGQMKSLYLPWHFCVELVTDRYFVFNTRPLDMKFPIDTYKALKQKEIFNITWNQETEKFFKNKLFDIENAVHVCLVGNTDIDIYTTKVYKLIGTTCVLPVIRQNKLLGGLNQKVFGLNLGKRVNLSSILKFIKS